jgi:hypothetical protein
MIFQVPVIPSYVCHALPKDGICALQSGTALEVLTACRLLCGHPPNCETIRFILILVIAGDLSNDAATRLVRFIQEVHTKLRNEMQITVKAGMCAGEICAIYLPTGQATKVR